MLELYVSNQWQPRLFTHANMLLSAFFRPGPQSLGMSGRVAICTFCSCTWNVHSSPSSHRSFTGFAANQALLLDAVADAVIAALTGFRTTLALALAQDCERISW